MNIKPKPPDEGDVKAEKIENFIGVYLEHVKANKFDPETIELDNSTQWNKIKVSKK